MKKSEKVYCSDCRYCGEVIYFTPVEYSVKNFYSHGVEIEQRHCNNPNIPNVEEFDTFYKHIKNHFNPVCHEINANNDCKYFRKKEVKKR